MMHTTKGKDLQNEWIGDSCCFCCERDWSSVYTEGRPQDPWIGNCAICDEDIRYFVGNLYHIGPDGRKCCDACYRFQDLPFKNSLRPVVTYVNKDAWRSIAIYCDHCSKEIEGIRCTTRACGKILCPDCSSQQILLSCGSDGLPCREPASCDDSQRPNPTCGSSQEECTITKRRSLSQEEETNRDSPRWRLANEHHQNNPISNPTETLQAWIDFETKERNALKKDLPMLILAWRLAKHQTTDGCCKTDAHWAVEESLVELRFAEYKLALFERKIQCLNDELEILDGCCASRSRQKRK